jgi:hypothetical protein
MTDINDYNILNDIFNDITNTMIINNLIIKNKIVKKIEIIKNLSKSNIDILNYNNEKKENLYNILKSINYKLMSVGNKQNKLNTKLNNILGILINNAYISSGFQVLFSNIPNIGQQTIDNKINSIDNVSIYDTIEHYIGNDTVVDVIQIDNDKYLAKFKDIKDAEKLCNLIHKMMIDPNIIRVEIIDNMDNMNNMDIFVNKEKQNEKQNERQNERQYNIHNKNTNDKTCDYDMCDYDIDYLKKKSQNINVSNKPSLYSVCLNLIYEKYSKIKDTITQNLQYIFSFYQKKI